MNQVFSAVGAFIVLLAISYFLFQYINVEEQIKKKNVLHENLKICCKDPLTGFYRDGYCNTGETDSGSHMVCAIMTDAFLQYSLEQGNDLINPKTEGTFPGLKAGDQWCLSIYRWIEAEQAGVAPPVILASTHEKALDYLKLELLERYRFSTLEIE